MGHIDLFHSRRTNYSKCPFWVRDERDKTADPSKWVLYHQSSGWFYAKPVSTKSSQMNVVNGVWAMDSNRVAIETDDDVEELTRGCVVQYNEELWIVEAVQRQAHWKESEFSKKQDFLYTISMVRG